MSSSFINCIQSNLIKHCWTPGGLADSLWKSHLGHSSVLVYSFIHQLLFFNAHPWDLSQLSGTLVYWCWILIELICVLMPYKIIYSWQVVSCCKEELKKSISVNEKSFVLFPFCFCTSRRLCWFCDRMQRVPGILVTEPERPQLRHNELRQLREERQFHRLRAHGALDGN